MACSKTCCQPCKAVHEQGFYRDIKPANLYVRKSDHRVLLIDFGAARAAVGQHSRSVTNLITPGYSPRAVHHPQ